MSFCALLLLCAIFEKKQVTSFVVPQPSTKSTTSSLHLSSLPSAEESAKALQDYMTKAHEEKLRALKELGDKKDKEIAELKNQLSNSGSSSITTTTSSSGDDIQELKNQLLQYQQFMSKYIVQAQEEKYRAVKEAEDKYKQKMLLLGSSSSSSATTSTTPPPVKESISLPESSKLYQDRSAKVAAAAAKGKSRWGDAEVQKIKGIANAPPAPSVATSLPATEVSPQIVAADHGLKRDGDLSLAERVAQGSKVENVLKKVAPSPPVIEVSPQIIAADHGLKRDGDLSLAERVVLGSKASAEANSNPTSSLATSTSAYVKRNQKLLNARKANKNHRWGDLEVARVTTFMEQLPQRSTSNGVEESVSVNIGAKILAL